MKSVAKPLIIISIILYVAGIITVAVYLYKLPGSLIGQSSVLHMDNITEITPALNQIMLVISLALSVGLAAIILLMLQSNSSGEIEQLEKFRAEVSDKQEEETETEELQDTSSLGEEILKQIKAIAASKNSPDVVLESGLRAVCKQLEACQGAVYVAAESQRSRFIEMRASYAYIKPDSQTVRYEFGEGLPGQVVKEGIGSIINTVPDGYIKILSGLGQASPSHLILAPVMAADKIVGLVEIASFTQFSKKHLEITQQAFALLVSHFEAASSSIALINEELSLEESENNSLNQ